MNTKKQIGLDGENLAADYLEREGYRILHRNWRYKRLEIDIIAEKDGVLIFVEVKARKNNVYGYPEEAVNDEKMNRLMEAAEEYIIQFDIKGEIRFDIVAITNTPKGPDVCHLMDAFTA
jgi:putative endonuclease